MNKIIRWPQKTVLIEICGCTTSFQGIQYCGVQTIKLNTAVHQGTLNLTFGTLSSCSLFPTSFNCGDSG